MKNQFSRRQFGRGLAAGALVTLAGNSTAGETRARDDGKSADHWEEVAPGVWKTPIGSPEAVTPVNSRLVAPAIEAMHGLPVVDEPKLSLPESVLTNRGILLRLPLAALEHIYGFGLQFFSLDHRGKKCVTRVNADPPKDTGDTHAPVPFYVSTLGYGIFVDTARYATFHCGNSRPKPKKASGVVSNTVDPLDTRTLKDEDSSEVLVEIPTARGVDVYLFAGPSMLDVVRRYNLFSGGGVLPPEWGMGFWYRVAGTATASDVAALARELRHKNIPCDVLGFEPGWQTHAYPCTYVWNPSRFQRPNELIRELRAEGYRVNLWEHAFIHPSSPLFESMQGLSSDNGVWGGLVPDFQNPEARRVFGDYHAAKFIDAGVSGFKLDECDGSDFTGGWSFADSSRFPSGVDGEQMHSLFGLRYQHALWKPYLDRGVETLSLVRSSGALAAPYPFVLYSDLYDHRQFVRALVNAGFSGLLWCPEVRDAKSEEDFIRRLQTAVFSPVAMINGWYISNPPWKQLDRKKNNAGEFASNWEELEGRTREIIGWRMQLVPYLRAAFARYAADGTPPFRALGLDWPESSDAANTDDAWMVGDRLLVAPLFADEPQGRDIYLPLGQWFNFWTGENVNGGTVVKFAADTREIPVFVKAGAILPLARVTPSTADEASHTLEVRVYGDGTMPFQLKTQYGSVEISWSRLHGAGSIHQSGTEKYTVSNWLRIDRSDHS